MIQATLPTARDCVKRAASETEIGEAREWLTRDEFGTWEKEADHWLRKVPEACAKKGLDIATVDVAGEIADILRLMCLKAIQGAGAKSKKRARS